MNNELSKLIDMKKSEEEIETNHFIIKDIKVIKNI